MFAGIKSNLTNFWELVFLSPWGCPVILLPIVHGLVGIEDHSLDQYDQGRQEDQWQITKRSIPIETPELYGWHYVIIKQHNKPKYINEIFDKHSPASKATISTTKCKYSNCMNDMFWQERNMIN